MPWSVPFFSGGINMQMHLSKCRWVKTCYTISVFAIVCPAHAGDLELALGDKAIQLSYLTSATVMGAQEQNINFGLLLTEERDIVGSVGITAPALLGDTQFTKWLSIAFGARGYFSLIAEPPEIEVFSLAPGLDFRFTLPTETPMRLTGSFYYAPKIMTFGDADDMYDFTARYEVDFTSTATGFIGYRLLRYDQEADDPRFDVDDDIHLGVRVTF
jgi:hypothetical protein